VLASLDTGASHCLFARPHAKALGLQVENVELLTFSTADSRFEAFGHELTIGILGIESTSMVYFFSDPNITKNVLSRQGWLDRIRLGLIDHDQELYLAAYDARKIYSRKAEPANPECNQLLNSMSFVITTDSPNSRKTA
jgi:hypothetical protein